MVRILSRWLSGLALLSAGLLSPSAWAVPALPPFGVYEDALFSPSITVLESNADRIRLNLHFGNLPGDTTLNLFRRLDGLWGELNQTGTLLPRFTIFLVLPPNGNPTVTIESWDTLAFPVSPRTIPENNPRPPLVSLGNVGVLGGVRVVPVTVHPLSYTDGEDTCQIATNAAIRVDIDDETGENPVATPRASFSRTWQKVYQALVTNWEFIPNFYAGTSSHLLIIVPDQTGSDFTQEIRSLVRWKEQRGMRVTVVGKSQIGANPTRIQIRARIIEELNAGEPRVDHVLLVGDETMLAPASAFTHDPWTRFSRASFPGSYTNENYFAAVEGSDEFPDLFVGRWVVNTEQEVLKLVNRSIQHERDTFAQDSLRFRRAAVAADMQEESQRGTKRHVRQELLRHGFAQVDSLWGDEVSPVTLVNWINSGLTFINYRGTGWSDGWAGINFNLEHVGMLTNRGKLPIVTGIGCGVCIFIYADDTGFAECWMTAGGVTTPEGAAGFVGPCWNTHTVYNDVLDSSLYKAWLDYDVPTVAAGLATGKLMEWAVLAKFLNDIDVLEVTQTMMRQYMVQGDPSLQVFTATPLRLQVTLPADLPNNASTLTVTVTNLEDVDAESLCVALWLNDSTCTTGWMRPGEPALTLPVALETADSVVVTVTGDNVLAFQQSIPVGPASAEPLPGLLPERLELAQNYPNPFNAETVITFALPRAMRVELEVFDLLGRPVATLAHAAFDAGWHRVAWHGAVASGVYYYRLRTPEGVLTRKMLLMR